MKLFSLLPFIRFSSAAHGEPRTEEEEEVGPALLSSVIKTMNMILENVERSELPSSSCLTELDAARDIFKFLWSEMDNL